MRLNICE